jgi:hypothetical protein
MEYTEREQVVEVINRLFYFTDEQLWERLTEEVFHKEVLYDMTSLGAQSADRLTSHQICAMWEEGFKDLDAVHHQAGNYIVEIKNDLAKAIVYSIASHYKKNATQGNTREYIGKYDLGFIKVNEVWRINSFKYNLKYMNGNLELV